MLQATLFTLVVLFLSVVDAKPISGPRYNAPHPHYNRTRAFEPRAATTTYASASQASAAYLKQAQDAEAGRNSGWTAVGCYRDSPTRTLNGLFIDSDDMTTKLCMNSCFGKGYTYGGVQYGRECWCGNKINSGTYTGASSTYIKTGDTYGTIVDYSECQVFPCSGDNSIACGNNWRNTIFMLSDATAANSAIAWSSSASAASASASIYSASAASAYSVSAKAYSTSAAAYSVSAAAFSSSSNSVAQASASAFSSSSLAASASAFSANSRAAASSAAEFSRTSSIAAASAAAYSTSAAQFSQTSLAAYSSQAAAYSQQQSLAAYSQSSQAAAASAAAYSSQAAAYSQQQSAAAYSQSSAAVYSQSSAAAYFRSSSSVAAYSQSSQAAAASAAAYSQSTSAAAYSSQAAAYSQQQSAAAYSQSSQAAAASAAAYSSQAAAYSQQQSVAAYSQSSAAAYSQSSAAAYSRSSQAAAQSAAAYSQSTSAAAYSSQAAAYSQQQSAAAYSQSSAAAYSQSSQAAAQSAAAYSQSQSAAAYSSNAAAYSQSTQAAAYSQSVQQAQQSAAAYSERVRQADASASAYSSSVAGYSASVQAQQSAAAYSSSVSASAAGYSASVQQAQQSAAAYSEGVRQAQASANAYSSSVAASASAAAYSASSASAAAAAATRIPETWSRARTQCIAEGTTGRALTGASISSPSMSYGSCIKYCNDQGFVLAGIEYSQECFCGNVLEHTASLNRPSAQCNMNCAGDSGNICGGPDAITLFVSNAALEKLSDDFTSKPITLQDGWAVASTACVAEGTTGRALTGAMFADDSMLPAKCMSFCKNKGFRLAGIEFGRECYCGSNLSNGASLDRSADNCNVACSGNPSLVGSCGGGGSLSLFSNPTLGSDQDSAAASASAASASASSAAAAASASASKAAADAQASASSAFQASLPSGWKAAASPCIEEVNGRALTGAGTAGDKMTVPACISFCSDKGFSMAGLEYGGECYCANSLSNGASLDRTANSCTMKCNGDSNSICGGPNGISLFIGPQVVASASASVSAAVASATPAGPQLATNLPAGWSSAGGIQEVPGRALTGYSTATANMTIQGCISICAERGFPLAAVEYGAECYCDSELRNTASFDKLSSTCNMGCAGDAKTLCGGPNCLSVYRNPDVKASAPSASASSSAAAQPTQGSGLATDLPSGWSAATTSCIQEVSGRALTGASTASDSMTPGKCAAFCAEKGFALAGVEYSAECFCGNDLVNGASLDLVSGQCNMKCSGDQNVICGGPNAISLWHNPNVKPAVSAAPSPAASSAASPASTSSAAAAKPTVSGIATNLPSGWTVGPNACIQEVAGRALVGASTSSNDMTPNKCIKFCSDRGFNKVGLEYGGECYCGNDLVNGASLDLVSGECNMPCTGDSSLNCGGANGIVYYQNKDAKAVTASTGGIPAGWKAASTPCIQEVDGRALSAYSVVQDNMTIGTCLNICAEKGYSLAGIEYGQECYCDNALQNSASLEKSSNSCTMTCPGNVIDEGKCGGPGALNLFTRA